MADDNTNDSSNEAAEQPQGGDEAGTIPRSRLNAVIAERDAARDRLAAIEAEQRTREEAALAENQQYRELAERRGAEIEALQAQIAEAALNNTRLQIGRELNLPPALVARLQGSNADELRADGEALLAAIPASVPGVPPVTSGKPVGPVDFTSMTAEEIRHAWRK